MSQERRAYSADEVDERRHTETKWREFGPRTMIANPKMDISGQYLDPKQKRLYSRLSKIQNSLVNSMERNFWEAKPKLKLLVSRLNIPEYIRETAWKIYTLVAEKKLTTGRSIDGFIAASLYAAIRIHEFPRLLDDILEASMTSKHTVIRSLGIIVKDILPILKLKYSPITAEQLVYKFGNELKFPMDLIRNALNLLQESKKKGLNRVGKSPKGIAAAVLYLSAKNHNLVVTQAQISNIAKVTEVTLRERIKEIKNII